MVNGFKHCSHLNHSTVTIFSDLNRDNLTQPIRTPLSQKHKAFSEFFIAFSKCTLNFEHFEKKDDPRNLFIFEITHSEKRG